MTVIRIAQSAGIPFAEIAEALSKLPRDTSPDTHDWERIAENWHYDLTRRIELLTALLLASLGRFKRNFDNTKLTDPDS